jgi:hypothetical protein
VSDQFYTVCLNCFVSDGLREAWFQDGVTGGLEQVPPSPMIALTNTGVIRAGVQLLNGDGRLRVKI